MPASLGLTTVCVWLWYLFLEPAFTLSFFSGKPPRTRSAAACQRLHAPASSSFRHPPHKRTNGTASTAEDQVVGAGTSGKLGWCGVRDRSPRGLFLRDSTSFWENICGSVDTNVTVSLLSEGLHRPRGKVCESLNMCRSEGLRVWGSAGQKVRVSPGLTVWESKGLRDWGSAGLKV